MLLPWNVAALMAGVLALFGRAARGGLTRRSGRSARWELAGAVAWEAAIVLALYALWMKLADLTVTKSTGAVPRGLWIWRTEQRWHFPSELRLQRLLLAHPLAIQSLNRFYEIVHVPALIIFLIWMFARHRDVYPRWRNALALLTLACLFIQTIPVAPPRLLPGLGFVDTAVRYGQSVYGTGGLKIAPQLAAMPSVHVGWAVFIAVAVISVSTSRWRWLIIAHPVLTLVAVVATANHWWLDGVVAAALLPVAFAVVVLAERSMRAVSVARARSARPVRAPVPAPAVLESSSTRG